MLPIDAILLIFSQTCFGKPISLFLPILALLPLLLLAFYVRHLIVSQLGLKTGNESHTQPAFAIPQVMSLMSKTHAMKHVLISLTFIFTRISSTY